MRLEGFTDKNAHIQWNQYSCPIQFRSFFFSFNLIHNLLTNAMAATCRKVCWQQADWIALLCDERLLSSDLVHTYTKDFLG